MLYACGSNGSGQLGLKHTEDVANWTEVPISLFGPIKIVGGGNHTLILVEQAGKVYVSHDAEFKEIVHPQNMAWKLISAGWDFSILIDNKNNVWVSKNLTLTKFNWKPPANIISVDSGLAHSVLNVSGTLYGFGASRKGQAGLKSENIDIPTEIDLDLQVLAHSCGKDFTALVSSNNTLHIIGNTRRFASLQGLEDTNSVQCGWSTIAVGDRIWGNNSHGQLDLPTNYTSYVLGSEHGIYSLEKESATVVGTWGWGEHGNCPSECDFEGKVQLFAGCATSFIYVM